MSRPVPAEWAPHRAMWLGFPSHEDLWEDNLAPAQDEVEALARALAGPGGERVRLMTGSDAGEAEARRRLDGVTGIEIVPGRFGDVWLRDTGPIFLGPEACVGFRFNGWGGKYDLPHDDEVAAQVAGAAGATLLQSEAVLEGGALDHDGEGTVLTTRQCLLNPNRNAGWTETRAEAVLARDLGARKVLWLGDGLQNDHTDGHVDNLARFVAPRTLVAVTESDTSSPNHLPLRENLRRLRETRLRDGGRLEIIELPLPKAIHLAERDLPPSHANFLIVNGGVLVPTYGQKSDDAALGILREAFPGRKVVGIDCRVLLIEGGALHCLSQQQPA